jgi:hypothetical protein
MQLSGVLTHLEKFEKYHLIPRGSFDDVDFMSET